MYNVGDYSGIGAMVDIFQSPTKVSEEQQFLHIFGITRNPVVDAGLQARCDIT